MARSSRQSKILELISTKEIETQDELARELKNANFEITQATISRDIKELGLTKILGSNGKYKYAILGSAEQQVVSNKYINIFKESCEEKVTKRMFAFLKKICYDRKKDARAGGFV